MPVETPTARQREIVAAARALLSGEGVDALTLGRVAQALQIKPPSLYKHFASKRHLEAALIAQGLEESAAALEAAGPDLHAVALAYRAYALEHPHLYRLMTERPLPRDLLSPELEVRAAAPLWRAVRDPELARAVWAFAHGMVALEIAGRLPPYANLDEVWRRGVDAFTPARMS